MCDVSIHVTVEGGGSGTHKCCELGFCIKEKLRSTTAENMVSSMYFVPIKAEVVGECPNEVKIVAVTEQILQN